MPTLLLFLGPQGAGKTSYAQAHFARFTRISQDDQGLEGHLRAFERALPAGENILIDRINHRKDQRLRYVLPAREAGYRIHYLWFDADRVTCLERLCRRPEHPTVTQTTTDHEKVLENYFRNFEPPTPDEYDRLRVLDLRSRASILDLRSLLRDKRTWIIGDVHGCFDELQRLLEKGRYQPGDALIFVGDLVNRGPKVAEVLRFARQTPETFILKGNHDERFARWLAGFRLELTSGLDRSIEAVAGWTPEERESCRQWIESWPYIVRLPDLGGRPFYVMHAGVDGRRPMEDQTREHCLMARYFGGQDYFDSVHGRFWYHTLQGDRCIASGHAPHSDPRPHPDVFALDGGAVKGGVLRALIRSPEQPSGQLLEVPGRTVNSESAKGGNSEQFDRTDPSDPSDETAQQKKGACP